MLLGGKFERRKFTEKKIEHDFWLQSTKQFQPNNIEKLDVCTLYVHTHFAWIFQWMQNQSKVEKNANRECIENWLNHLEAGMSSSFFTFRHIESSSQYIHACISGRFIWITTHYNNINNAESIKRAGKWARENKKKQQRRKRTYDNKWTGDRNITTSGKYLCYT